jgi:hypothetical protein
VTALDDVRVEKVDFWVDGRLEAIDRTSPYSFAWDAAAVGQGALSGRTPWLCRRTP